MNEKMKKIKEGKGFIAALDQSGGSTPKALALYGVLEDAYKNEEEMFDLVHEMRTRIVTSKPFTGERIIGAILFEATMNKTVENIPTPDYLWEKKGVVPFLKIDVGLAPEQNGVRLMKEIPNFVARLKDAVSKHIFGTKMRSVISEYNEEGIRDVVRQQFDFAKTIVREGLVPIVEPEITITMENKAKAEEYLLHCIQEEMKQWDDKPIMFKLTIPEEPNLYAPLMEYPCVLRVVALSGGYEREDANARLAKNHGMIASFSRALTEGLHVGMTKEEFESALDKSIEGIYNASIA